MLSDLKTTQSTSVYRACDDQRNFSNFPLIVAISYLFLDAFQCPGLGQITEIH